MNPSTAQAEVLVDELVRNGVRHVVLAPGSRNAPLSFAFYHASDRLDLHVRIDERSAGYLALGLAARTGAPVVVVCTSGTAAANLHPAVREAEHAGVPLIVLTADRPPEMRAAGANQSIDQHRLYGAVRYFHDLGVAENRPGQNAYWRTQVCRAWQAAEGSSFGGPVQLNLPFRDPLVPDADRGGAEAASSVPATWCESRAGRVNGRRWTEISGRDRSSTCLTGLSTRRGLVLVAGADPNRAGEWGQRHGWPVLAETGGVGLRGSSAISTGMWLLNLPEFVRANLPEQVLCVGRPTVFRQVQALLSSETEVLLVHGDDVDWPAPGNRVREVAESWPDSIEPGDPDWLARWQQADKLAGLALHTALEQTQWPSGPVVARDVLDVLPPGALLTVGSSNPTRDIALAARQRPDVILRRNRGVAGIDGTVSTAIGGALAHDGPAYALLGDLTFLHDSNGMLRGTGQPEPDLTIVVFNDDGGGIFSLLEQGRPEFADAFETLFGTPHGTDLGRLCAAHGVAHTRVAERADLVSALRWRPGLRVVEVAADRARLRSVHDQLHAAVRAAVLG